MSTGLLVVSLLVQLLAAWQALRLVRITGRRSAWVLIAAAVLLMAMRRLVTLVDVSAGHRALDPIAELIALTISLLMLGGISLIGPLFRSIERSRRALAESEERYAALIRDAPDAIVAVADDNSIQNFNPEATRITGLDAEEAHGQPLADTGFFVGEQLERIQAGIEQARSERRAGPMELEVVDKDGAVVPVEANLQRIEGRKRRVKIVMRDITARRVAQEKGEALEQQLEEARRLEALGQLAGGIAHDFNNLLTVMIGTCQIMLDDKELPRKSRAEVEAVAEAAKRAASLTGQLLAFGRRQVLEASKVDLHEALDELADLLSRLVGENARLEIDRAATDHVVFVDPTQLDQVVLNLVTNARDATPAGGVITISTGNVDLEADEAQSRGLTAGRYVTLAVNDHGDGMDSDTQQRIFEPFFTTKKLGKGSGLGLATVHGIVKQSSGHIEVDSEPSRGTTLTVLLPAVVGEELPKEPSGPRSMTEAPSKTVLLVEDEPAVREVLRRGLVAEGFKVFSAGDAEQALARCAEADGRIDAMVTDVVMPGRSGPELARVVEQRFPSIKILMMSGHAAGVLAEHSAPSSAAILQKPFSSRQLADRLGRLLSGS